MYILRGKYRWRVNGGKKGRRVEWKSDMNCRGENSQRRTRKKNGVVCWSCSGGKHYLGWRCGLKGRAQGEQDDGNGGRGFEKQLVGVWCWKTRWSGVMTGDYGEEGYSSCANWWLVGWFLDFNILFLSTTLLPQDDGELWGVGVGGGIIGKTERQRGWGGVWQTILNYVLISVHCGVENTMSTMWELAFGRLRKKAGSDENWDFWHCQRIFIVHNSENFGLKESFNGKLYNC